MGPVTVWFRPHGPAGFDTIGTTKPADAQYEPKCDPADTHRRPLGHGDVNSPSYGMGCVDARIHAEAREMCVGPRCGDGTLPVCRDNGGRGSRAQEWGATRPKPWLIA
jgi:hypothetical protein